jgi:hypothetical protein
MTSNLSSIRVGVLLCDDLHEELRTRWPSYLSLFETLLLSVIACMPESGRIGPMRLMLG